MQLCWGCQRACCMKQQRMRLCWQHS
jgi:hypothetical protein